MHYVCNLAWHPLIQTNFLTKLYFYLTIAIAIATIDLGDFTCDFFLSEVLLYLIVSIANTNFEISSVMCFFTFLRFVYVWHALLGYWGGLHPDAPGTKKYNPELKFPVQSPGNLAHIRDLSMDCMEKYGVGMIDPAKISVFYDDLHKYLVSQEVDGVKVDVQNILETMATGLGGRVSLTRHFQEALERSIATHFKDNSIICCMGHNTDSVYKY